MAVNLPMVARTVVTTGWSGGRRRDLIVISMDKVQLQRKISEVGFIRASLSNGLTKQIYHLTHWKSFLAHPYLENTICTTGKENPDNGNFLNLQMD